MGEQIKTTPEENQLTQSNNMDELDSRYLTFLIGDAIYGIALTNVLEIINIQSITQVPNIPPHIKGIINLRGKVIPVLDARLKMYKEERPYDDKTLYYRHHHP